MILLFQNHHVILCLIKKKRTQPSESIRSYFVFRHILLDKINLHTGSFTTSLFMPGKAVKFKVNTTSLNRSEIIRHKQFRSHAFIQDKYEKNKLSE